MHEAVTESGPATETAATSTAPTFYPALRYRDAYAAMDWLESAFGFERNLVVPGPENTVAHAQLAFGNGVIMLGSVKDDALQDRAALVYTYVADVDGHCARARAAGARIIREPADTEYGSREYGAEDLEGNLWSFGTYRPSADDR